MCLIYYVWKYESIFLLRLFGYLYFHVKINDKTRHTYLIKLEVTQAKPN